MKSLEVSEEKANQRVEEFKREMKTLAVRLKDSENRAENAEKSVKRLQKEVDRLEGMFKALLIYSFINYSMQDSTQCIERKNSAKEQLREKKLLKPKETNALVMPSVDTFC